MSTRLKIDSFVLTPGLKVEVQTAIDESQSGD